VSTGLRAFATKSDSESDMESGGPAKKKQKPDYLYGLNPVMASLSAERREFSKLYLNISEKPGAGGEKQKHVSQNPKVEAVAKMAKKLGVKIKYMHRAKLAKFCGNRPHQNVVLKCSRLEYENICSMKELLELTKPQSTNAPQTGKFFIFLDQVTDP
jgi:tRNA G18 (ribose-2'-O)-methylase SpoU